MVVLGIVPGEECLAEGPGVLDGTEPLGEIGPVFHGLELRFGIRIVVADRGSRMAFDDPEIGHEQGNGFRGHARPPVRVDEELPLLRQHFRKKKS